MATVEYAHISFDADNVPVIASTRTKVRLVVEDLVYRGWDAEEIRRQYPYLTLGQIHSALAYYYDHKDEMDAELERLDQDTEHVLAEIGDRQGGFCKREDLVERLRKKTDSSP